VNQAQAATLSEKPVSPSKLSVGALSLFLMFAGTTGLVLGCEQLRLAKEHSRAEATHANGANGTNGVAVERREYAPANPR
jgi:hypothetical protein